jgi:cytochrome c peroxidase
MRPVHIATLLCLFACLLLLGEACRKSDTAATGHTPMQWVKPEGFPEPLPLFRDNPLTKEGFELGRTLFHDGNLAKDGKISCASCHQPFAAFSTFDHAFSHGVDDKFTTRNAPGLFNLAWYPQLHWDGGINHLEVQPLSPITAPNEMGETIEGLVRKLNADAKYRELFRKAFGEPEVTSQRMLKALSQFMGSILSADSKYDRVMKGRASFTLAEESGYTIFKAKCASCHREPLFTDHSFRNTGIPVNPQLRDLGRMTVTRQSSDSAKFKVPSLRNVMLTAPYGHDGRFASVGAVIDHYRSSVMRGPTLDPSLRNGISMSNNERADLIQFLTTLTDTTFTKDPRFGPPR